MRTPAQALLWELWRMSRWKALGLIAGMTLFWVIAFNIYDFYLVFYEYDTQFDYQYVRGYFSMFALGALTIAGLAAAAMLSDRDKGNPFIFPLGFIRPIGTPLLVAGPMLYLASLGAITYLIPAAILRILFDFPLPLAPVAALIFAYSLGSMMATWPFSRPATRRIAPVVFFALAIVIIGVWYWRPPVSIYELPKSPDRLLDSFPLTFVHYTALLLFSMGAIGVTTLGVGRLRQGRPLGWIWRAPESWKAALPEGRFALRTPARAQFWFETRRAAGQMLTSSWIFPVGAFFGILVAHKSGYPWLPMWCVVLAGMALNYAFCGSVWLAGLRRNEGVVSLSIFDMTQAMTNTRLVAIKLAVLTAFVSLAWLMAAGAAILWTALFGDFHEWVSVGDRVWAIFDATIYNYEGAVWHDGPTGLGEYRNDLVETISAPWLLAFAMVLAILYVTGNALLFALTLAGPLYRFRFSVAVAVVLANFALAALGARHKWALERVWEVEAWAVSLALILTAILATRKTLIRGYMTKRQFGVIFGLWMLFASVVVAFYFMIWPQLQPNLPFGVTLPSYAPIMGVALITIPLSAVALAPLAIAAHRHR